MDETGIVGCGQTGCGLQVGAQTVVERSRIADRMLILPLDEIAAGDKLHSDEDLSLRRLAIFPDFVDVHHVGMGNPRHRLGFF